MITLGPGWDGPITILVLPDIHYPLHCWRAISIVKQVARSLHLDAMIQLGDLLDIEGLGRWAKDAPGQTEGQRLVEDIDLAAKGLWGIMDAARERNPDCKGFLLEGNHEERIKRLANSVPYLKGLIDLPEMLKLEELGIQWCQCDSQGGLLRFDWTEQGIRPRYYTRDDWITKEQGIAFIHGWFASMHAAKQHSERYGRGPIFFGHTHRLQTYVPHSYGEPKPYACSLGHLRSANPDWIKSPLAWQQAFAVLTIGKHVGAWEPEIVRINSTPSGKRRCLFRGVEFQA